MYVYVESGFYATAFYLNNCIGKLYMHTSIARDEILAIIPIATVFQYS